MSSLASLPCREDRQSDAQPAVAVLEGFELVMLAISRGISSPQAPKPSKQLTYNYYYYQVQSSATPLPSLTM